MPSLEDFSEITKLNQPLAEYTWLRVGGPAQYFIEPRNLDELREVVACCHANEIPVHVMGSASNLLVREEGVSGAVIRLSGDNFSQITIEGTQVRAQAGALLSNAISQCIQAGLGGLEVLAGIPGTVGGALVGNAGGKSGDIGQFVESIQVMTSKGDLEMRSRDEISYQYRSSSITDLVVLEGVLNLKQDDPDEISNRMKKIWIMKKATQPLSFQSAGCIFKNSRGAQAGALIEEAGLKGMRVGDVEVSEQHANFFVTHSGAKADDVLRLIDLVHSKVNEQFGVDLELEIKIW